MDEDELEEPAEEQPDVEPSLPPDPYADLREQTVFECKPLGLVIEVRQAASALVQRDIDVFSAALRREQANPEHADSNGQFLRAAIRAGWVVRPKFKVAAVDGLDPRHVAFYGDALAGVWLAARHVPLG